MSGESIVIAGVPAVASDGLPEIPTGSTVNSEVGWIESPAGRKHPESSSAASNSKQFQFVSSFLNAMISPFPRIVLQHTSF